MVTRFYFHNSASGQQGTLPNNEQSTARNPTTNATFDAVTVNKTMNTTKGSNQVGLTRTPLQASATTYYVTRFISQPIYQTTVSAQTWTYGFATSETSTSHNWPVSGNNVAVPITIYVWRPSTGARIGYILDGNTAATVDEGGTGTRFHIASLTGSEVTGVQDGDVIVCEIWFAPIPAVATGTIGFYFDGTDDTYADGATSVTQAASYLETPENLVLVQLTRVTNANTLLYNVAKQITNSVTLRYDLVSRITNSVILRYNSLIQITNSNTLKYSLLKQITNFRTLAYNLLRQITHSNILVYNVAQAASGGNTITHNAGETITWYTANNEPGLTNWPNGTYTWYLKITQGNANVTLTDITLLRLNSARDTVLASKATTPSIILSTAQTYSGTIDWNDGTQNPEGRNSSDTFAYTIGTTGTQSVTISFDTPNNTRIATPLEGIRAEIYRIIHSNILKYNLLKQVTKQNSLQYNLIGRIISAITLQYNLLNQITKQNTLRYSLIGRIVHTINLRYNLLKQITNQNTIKYNLAIQVLKQNTLKYNLRKQVTKSNTLLWNIFAELARIASNRTLRYNLIQRQTHASNLRYNITKQVLNPSTLRYSILNQVKQFNTLRYSLLKQVTKQNTLQYNLIQRIQNSLTLIYRVVPFTQPPKIPPRPSQSVLAQEIRTPPPEIKFRKKPPPNPDLLLIPPKLDPVTGLPTTNLPVYKPELNLVERAKQISQELKRDKRRKVRKLVRMIKYVDLLRLLHESD